MLCQGLVHIFLWKLPYKTVSILSQHFSRSHCFIWLILWERDVQKKFTCWNFFLGDSPKPKSMQLSEWFASLQEFRSLLHECSFIALTATAARDTREAIFESLLFNNPCMVLESPNKENISYVVPKDIPFSDLMPYWTWVKLVHPLPFQQVHHPM